MDVMSEHGATYFDKATKPHAVIPLAVVDVVQ